MMDLKTLEIISKEIISEVELTVEDEGVTVNNHPRSSENLDMTTPAAAVAVQNETSHSLKMMKTTRVTRLVVHVARKGRKRHRSIAAAFLDEHLNKSIEGVEVRGV